MGIEVNINNSQVIWRYMDLSKLLSLLVNETLTLPRVDIFNDPYEGYPNNYLEVAKKSYMNNPLMMEPYKCYYETGLIQNLIKLVNLNSYVSCWHMNDYESAAMWKLYCNSSDSIVIKTTVKKLKMALNSYINELSFGGVRYDFKFKGLDKLEFVNLIDPLFSKRESFEHEKEFRVIFSNYESFNLNREIIEKDSKNYINNSDLSVLSDEVKTNLEAGLYFDIESGKELSEDFLKNIKQTSDKVVNLSIDPSTLIEEILISPDADDWFVETVQKTISLLGYNFKIYKSDLNKLI